MVDKYLSKKGKTPNATRGYRSRFLDEWYITCVIRRHNGVFAFIRKDEGNKIFVRYIKL